MIFKNCVQYPEVRAPKARVHIFLRKLFIECYGVLKRLKIKLAQERVLSETTLKQPNEVGIDRNGISICNAKKQPV